MDITRSFCDAQTNTDIAILNDRLPISLDWWRKLARALNANDTPSLVKALTVFAGDHGLTCGSLMTPELRQKLIENFDSLQLKLIGPHLEQRCLLNGTSESTLFDRCIEIVREANGAVFDMPFVPQVLAIRGVRRDGQTLWQTDSAAYFAAESYGQRTHFSSAKQPFLDSAVILFWRNESGEKHALIFDATVNPNMIWPEGTAHLCDGQYTFKLGRHRTYSRPHIDAVVQAAQNWPSNWIYELDDAHVRYIALEGTSPIHVIRSSGDSLDLSQDDITCAERAIAHYDKRFVDCMHIKINIHTCPQNAASSLGCQNIAIDQYGCFIDTISSLETAAIARFGHPFETWYSLIDASKINA